MLDLPHLYAGGPLWPSPCECYCHHRTLGFFSDELSVVVGNDRIRDPEMENDFLDEIYDLFRADLS
jgi:hypothetical protein